MAYRLKAASRQLLNQELQGTQNMRLRLNILAIVSFIAWPAILSSTVISWGTAEEWLPRCELAEVYLEDALIDEPTTLSVTDVEQAVSCTAFIEGYRLGTTVGDLESLRRKYGQSVPSTALESLVGTHCCTASSEELIHGLVEYLRDVARERPPVEIDLALYGYFKKSCPCQAGAEPQHDSRSDDKNRQ